MRILSLRGRLSRSQQAAIISGILIVAGGAFSILPKQGGGNAVAGVQSEDIGKREAGRFYPTASQWASLKVEAAKSLTFRDELMTEGKIVVNEDHSTSIFSPYTGRVTKLLVAPGDHVESGQPLFVLEAADSVQMQNEFMTAASTLNKVRSQVGLAETVERRLRNLYDAKAAALKEWQQAQADLTATQNDLRSAQMTLEATRNRLRILGKTNDEIDLFQRAGTISPDATIFAPLAGTVVNRKMGPGQYIAAGSSDPVLVIGDLSSVWLLAFVRESDASKVKIGQAIKFTVLAKPDRIFEARINYVASSIDPNSRRRTVRATVANPEALFAPEMFATVRIVVGEGAPTAAVPREAVIYEANTARIWVVRDDRSVELRPIRLGLSGERMIQVLDGLAPGEKIVTKGSLFIDRLAASLRS